MSEATVFIPPVELREAVTPVAAIPSSRPVVLSGVGWLLQFGHRAGSLAFLAGLAAIALAYLGNPFYLPLAVAFGAAVAGACAGLLATSALSHGRLQRREAVGVVAFNASLAAVALVLMLVARAGVIQTEVRQTGETARATVSGFFTPPPVLPPP